MGRLREKLGKYSKKVILSTLSLVMVLGVVSSSLITAKADSNDRISTFINFAAGKQTSDMDINDLSLSERDLQFLGVYISNFFIPFGTELGTNDDVTSMNKEDIKEALQTNINFSDALAESLTETMLGLSRASVKELTLCVSKEYQGDLVEVPDMPLNYYTVLTCMLGGLDTLAKWYEGDSANSAIKGIKEGKYKYGYFAYQKEGAYVPVFDFSIKMEEITPSVGAFIKCLESVDIESGYGFNFFDFTKSEMGVSEGDYKDKSDTLTNSQLYKMSAYGGKLAVDCFGNIILMGGNHQFVAVPGAMNPYTWVTVDSEGTPTGKGYGGTAYNMANIPSMALHENNGKSGNSLFTSISKKDNGGNDVDAGDGSDKDSDITYAFTGQMGPNGKWFDEIGNSDDKYINNGGILGIGSNSLKEYIDYIIDYCGGSKVSTKDFETYVKNGALYIRGNSLKLSAIDWNRATDKYLNSSNRDKAKADKMKKYISALEGYSISRDDKDKKEGLLSNLKAISKKGSDSLLNSGTVVEDNDSSDMVIQGILNTKDIVSKLKKVAWNAEDGAYTLRKVRGSADSDLSSGILDTFVGSDYRALAMKAEKGFIEANPKAKNYYNGNKEGIKDGWLSKTQSLDVYGVGVEGNSKLATSSKMDVLDSFVYTDDLGAAHFDNSSESADYKTFNVEHYTSGSEKVSKLKESMSSWGSSANNGFTNTYKDIENGKMVIPNTVSKEAMVGLYMTYAYSSLYDSTSSESVKSTIGSLGYKMNSDNLPEIPDEPLVLSDTATEDMMDKSIKEWIYYLLHPTEGIKYFTTWITNKLNGFMLGWHDDMVGTRGTGSINGTTKYRGFSGYVTTPELTDMPWTNSLLDLYNNAIPFLLVFMIVVMLGAYIVGTLSLQKSIIGFMIFAICVTLPSVAINSMVGTSNRFSSKLYGEKFTYWALVQHESYSKAIDEAASGESYTNYLKTLYATNSQAKGNQGSESIMLKWQAPKKMASLMMTSEDESVLNSLNSSSLLSGLINSTYSGESYLDDEDSVYLYRSYIDIANFSRYIHRGLSNSLKQPINMSLTSDITSSWDASLVEAIQNYDSVYEADRSLGYANKNGDGSTSGSKDNILRVKLPLSSKLVTDAYDKIGSVSDMSLDDYVGINQDAFQFSIPMFNVDSLDYYEELGTDNFNAQEYTREDFSGLAAYGLMSENPFYYFSWYLYESGLSEETTANTGYKNLLLGEDNAGFFYNTKGNGEMKDFVDMRSLFTYIIPYLRQGNDLVKEWDKVYGLKLYEGVPTEEGHQDDPDIKESKELQQKYWHNLNVARLYNVYTPWVDVMYDCSYADEEKISYLGESYVVTDPLNPATYPDERPMIFSKSEMVDYGLKESQLTAVEKKILECQEGMQERLFNLLNYHTFNDVVLNTAAAMNLAFEFNTTFSENSLVGANHNIYPQAFELNDFSYDAFLRFILSNSTGESMVTDGTTGFYNKITANSSMTTVIVLLILDVLAMYVIPGLKIFFIVGIFLMGIMIILMTAFRVDSQQKFIKRLFISFIKPLLQFLGISCLMAFVVSLFMGEGSTSITGSMGASISLGDPVMAMLAMIVLNVLVMIGYFKILRGVWKDLKRAGKLVGGFVTGVLGALGGAAASTLMGNRRFAGDGFGGSSGGSSSRSSSKHGDFGSGSSRAKQRGNSTIIINKMNESTEESKNSYRDKKRDNVIKNHNSNNMKGSSDIESKTKKGLESIKKSFYKKDKE